MVAKKKTVAKKTTKKRILKKKEPQSEVKKIEKFFVKEFHKHHVLGLIVAVLLGITALLLLVTYISNQ